MPSSASLCLTPRSCDSVASARRHRPVVERHVTVMSARGSDLGSEGGTSFGSSKAQERVPTPGTCVMRLADAAELDDPAESTLHLVGVVEPAGVRSRLRSEPWQSNLVAHQGQVVDAANWKSNYQDSHEEMRALKATVRITRSTKKRWPRRIPLPQDELEALRQRKLLQEEAWKEMLRKQWMATGASETGASEVPTTASWATAGLASKEVEKMAARGLGSHKLGAELPRGYEPEHRVAFPWRV
mmetsp:Transcript_4385/g.10706  ORF Transcript_4385/g.10706 Transcript_4385/m.10706 type:complete len:243 (-) Transcript_4385:63-791(-)